MSFTLKSNTVFITALIQLMFAFLLIALSRHYQIHITEMWEQNGSYLRGIIEKIATDQKHELDQLASSSDIYPEIQIAHDEYYTINRSQLFSLDVHSEGDYKNEFEKYRHDIREILIREAEASEVYDLIFFDTFFQEQVITSHDDDFDRQNAHGLNDLIKFAKKEREINSVFYYADADSGIIYLCKIYDIPSIGAINPGFLIWRKVLCDHINSFFPQDEHFKASCSSPSLSDSGRRLVNYPIQNSQGNMGYIRISHSLTNIHTFFVFNLFFISFLFLICCFLFFYRLFIYPHEQLMDTFNNYLKDSESTALLYQNSDKGNFLNSMAGFLNKSITRYQDIINKFFVQKSLIQRYKKDFSTLETWCNQFLNTMQKICDIDPASLDTIPRQALQSKFKTIIKMSAWKPPILEKNQAEKHSSTINSKFDLLYHIRRSLKAHSVRWYMAEQGNIPKEVVLDVDTFTSFWGSLLETDFPGINCGSEGLVSVIYEENIGRIDISLKLNIHFSPDVNSRNLIRDIEHSSQIITASFFSKSFMVPLSWEIQGDYIYFKFGIEQNLTNIPSSNFPSVTLKGGLSSKNILVISESSFLQEVIGFYLDSHVNYIYFAENIVEAAVQINQTSVNFHCLITDGTVGGVNAVDFIPHFIIPSFIIINRSASDRLEEPVCTLDNLFSGKELIDCLNTRPINSDSKFVFDSNDKMDSSPTCSNVSVVSIEPRYFPIVEAFLQDFEKNTTRMIDLGKESDTEEIKRIAHALKGTSRSFQFLHKAEGENYFGTIADMAASIEACASDGSENIIELVGKMKDFANTYHWICR